jgi:hypothetical protein
VSWIADTGDLYAVAMEGHCPDRFILIANFPDEESVEEAMHGWTERDHDLAAIVEQARSMEVVLPAEVLAQSRQTNSRIYVGRRMNHDSLGNSRAFVVERGKVKRLHHVQLHSEAFEWAYGGSGPADLALSILADYFREHPTKKQLHSGDCQCWQHHQAFKWAFIAPAPSDGFVIAEGQIAEWLDGQPSYK